MAEGKSKSNVRPLCGIVMPISSSGDCTESHWAEVLKIISDAVGVAGFDSRLVSSADEVTVIQKTIVQNLYNCPIVVVDVSEKNPNVMFELGMRLAFDMPTVIIKDDCTNFSFDTGVIEHVPYRRDLRFQDTVDFKELLGQKVLATFEKKKADKDFSSFLKHFGQFKVASLDEKEVSGQEFIIEQLGSMQKQLDKMRAPFSPRARPISYPAGNEIEVCCTGLDDKQVAAFKEELLRENLVKSVRVVTMGDHQHLMAASDVASVAERREAEDRFYERVRQMHGGRPRPRLVRHRGSENEN